MKRTLIRLFAIFWFVLIVFVLPYSLTAWEIWH